ncbi:MAG TPA: alpha/beta fold hydrolase [Bacteroidota bacterium]|nr:alpha/beta fold hydrolase [Bacteroidota bacterium]
MKLTIQKTGIEYSVRGPRTGIPVVLVHGFPFDQRMWDPQVEALCGKYYTVTYDVRGHGKSETGDGQYNVELFVDDLIALLDHLKISRAVLVGLSMGGYIALRTAERNPERVRALVLCDTRSEADGNEGKIRRAAQANLVRSEGLAAFLEPFLQGVFYKGTYSSNPELVSTIRSTIERTSPRSITGTLIALAGRTDTTPALYSIRVPTLILVGKNDTLTPVSASTAMKEKIPGAKMHIIPKAGHLSNLENPQEFNERLLDFLAGLKP